MGDAYLYDGKKIEVGGQKIKVPKFSEWEDVCSCGNCHVAYFPEIRKYFCNDLEVDIPTTIMSICLVLLIFAFELWSICISTEGITRISLLIVGSILHAFWLFSHLEAMFTSPGYLPWFWSIEQRKEYTYKEKFSGIITNKEQYNFAIQGVCPERAIVSASGRRIVLRADLNCGWINNWVGVGNYRYFFIMLLWLFAIFLFYFIVFIFDMIDISTNGWKLTAPRIAFFVSILPILIIFVYFIRFYFAVFKNMLHNQTRVFDDEPRNYYDLGDFLNCEEAFGPVWCSPFWLFPVPFPSIRNGLDWVRNDGNHSSYEMTIRDPELVMPHNTETQMNFYQDSQFYLPGQNQKEKTQDLEQHEEFKEMQNPPKILLEGDENDDDFIYLVEYSDDSNMTEVEDQTSTFMMSSGVDTITDSDMLTTSTTDTSTQDGISNDKINVTGQPLKQQLPTPTRTKHRIRKTKIGQGPAVHPQPPVPNNMEFPPLEPYLPRRPIEKPDKDKPIRFFNYR